MADPGFPRWEGGDANPLVWAPKTYYLAIFCQKLHENEKIELVGGRASSTLPDPPMTLVLYVEEANFANGTGLSVILIVHIHRNFYTIATY